jgi:hypothetical protein
MMDVSELGGADLSRYTHIILPNGRYPIWTKTSEGLTDWVRGGGVLIGIRGGARWAISNELSTAQWLEDDGEDGDLPDPQAYDTINAWDAEIGISGAVFEAEVDVTHPLLFGLRDSSLSVHKIGNQGFAPGRQPVRPAGALCRR